jgi:hypothetical protein
MPDTMTEGAMTEGVYEAVLDRLDPLSRADLVAATIERAVLRGELNRALSREPPVPQLAVRLQSSKWSPANTRILRPNCFTPTSASSSHS